MTRVRLPHVADDAGHRHLRRTERLERATQEPPPREPTPLLFSLAGALDVSESMPHPYPGGRLIGVEAWLLTAGSTASTVVVKVNGVVRVTVTIGAGETRVTQHCSIGTSDTDTVTVAVTAAGTAASGLGVGVRRALG